MQFKDVITDPAQFRELMGEPPPPCVAKTIAILDRPPGFIRVLDDKTLAVPDRPGNRRADTFANVLENPRVGLIFFVPGKSETL